MEKKSIFDFFDYGNYEHLKAFQHVLNTSCWPKDFFDNYLKDIEFPPAWQTIIGTTIAQIFLNTMLHSMDFMKGK
jgi:hypothetical protein